MFSFTASALKSSPFWNFTPWRSLTVHTVASAFGVADSASHGCRLPSESTFISGSNTALVTYAHATGHCASGMNQPVLFSASRPIESDPPATGFPAAVVAAPAAVVPLPAAVVLELFLLSPPQAAATEASTTPTAMAFHASERVENKVSPNRTLSRCLSIRDRGHAPSPS